MSTTVPIESVTRIFTFGYGQTCQYTGKPLDDHYAVVTATTAAATVELMYAVFGRNWSFDYDGPDDPRIAGYMDRMTEHVRLNIGIEFADPTGLDYSREPDDPAPGTVPAEIEGHPEYTGRASVNGPQCLPGCYEPTLEADHVPGCPVGGE